MILFRNSRLHTPPSESKNADLLIDDNGIIKTGRFESMPECMILENKFLLPGYIDSHIHLLEHGLLLLFLDLREVSRSHEVLEMLAEKLNEAQEHGFLYAFNLAPERLKESNWEPSSDELDRISKDIPIFVRREDGHSVYMNRAARRWLLYDQPIETANEPLIGRFNELAVERMQERIPRDIRVEAFKLADHDLLSKGVTSAGIMTGNDMTLDDVEIINSLGAGLKLTAHIFPQNKDIKRVCEYNLTRLGGCILIDGSLGSRTAALREPYSDAPGNNGILYFSKKELYQLVQSANDAGLQMTFHAIGDEAIELILNVYEKVIGKGNPLRHRIEHAELLPPDLIEKTARLGIILSVQPLFEIIWGWDTGMYSERLGERRRWTNPFSSAKKAGIKLAAGSDAPITTPDPDEGIKAFLNHPIKEERITVEEALRAYTSNAAYALHAENEIGSIRDGLEADILVFDKDPYLTLDFRPKAVIKKGKLVSGLLP